MQIRRGKILWQGVVYLHGDITFAEDSELTIAPGSQIIFQDPEPGEDIFQEHPNFVGSELIIKGRLLALGTAAQPIIFRAEDPLSPAGSWGGINIENSVEARFAHCEFKQANSAIHARESRVVIEESIFRDNLVGVRFHDTQLLMERNLLEDNGTAIRFHFGAPVIRYNLIQHNRKGLFISERPQNYRIENNRFIDNLPYQVNLGEGVRKAVDLTNNYWSEEFGGQLETHFFDGRVDDWLGVVEYEPRSSQTRNLEE